MRAVRAIAYLCSLCVCAVVARADLCLASGQGAPAAASSSAQKGPAGTETMIVDLIAALGRGWGETELRDLIAAFQIEGTPHFKPDDITAFLQNRALGVELTFRHVEALDVPPLNVAPGRFVLSNIRLYGPGSSSTHAAFVGDLPLGLRFGDTREALLNKFGPPDVERINLAAMHSMRWDTERYALFALMDKADGGLAVLALQLPVVATSKPGFERR